MTTAVIVDAIRTPLGRRNGRLKEWHSVDLAAEVLKAIQERNDLDPALIDDVVMGCVMQVGEQGPQHRPQRRARRRLPRVGSRHHDRPPVRFSSQQAAHFAAQGVIAGAYDVVDRRWRRGHEPGCPMGSSVPRTRQADGFPFGPAQVGLPGTPTGGLVVPQGISAEMIADKWGISRDDLDAFGVPSRSQRRAAQATAEGRFQTTRSSR